MVVHSEKEAHVVRLTQQLELLVAHPEWVGQIVRTPAADRLLRDIAEYIAEVNTRRQHEQQGKQNFKKL